MTKRLEDTAKIIVLKKDIPFRADTAVYKRAQAVLRAKTVAEAVKRGARTSTIRFLAECKQIRIEPPKKAAPRKAVAA